MAATTVESRVAESVEAPVEARAATAASMVTAVGAARKAHSHQTAAPARSISSWAGPRACCRRQPPSSERRRSTAPPSWSRGPAGRGRAS
eukprot:843609-Pleurochrysis_carterae.AAC.1